METGRWVVQVFGEKCSKHWEISVTRIDHSMYGRSWGWFDDGKLLVSHNGGPGEWPIAEFVWERHIRTANALCYWLNRIDDLINTNHHEDAIRTMLPMTAAGLIKYGRKRKDE